MAAVQAQRIGLVYQPRKPEAAELAAALSQHIQAAGTETWTESAWEEAAVSAALPGTDLVLTFGGDGTIIRTLRLAAPLGVAVAGVNFGKLGFLAEVEADEVAAALPRLLAAEYWCEARALLAITHRRAGAVVGEYLAVNEALISRGRANRVVRLQLWIHGEYVTTYAADGLILATPTGSTGSNLANLGPVLPPEMRALIVSPVLPFVSFPNPLIVPDGAPLRVRAMFDHEAVLAIDGQRTIALQNEDVIEATIAPYPCLLARLRGRHYFYRVLVPGLQRAPLLPSTPKGG